MTRMHGLARGSTALRRPLTRACVVVVAADDSGSDELLLQAVELYGGFQRDRSSGHQSQQNTVALHKSAISCS